MIWCSGAVFRESHRVSNSNQFFVFAAMSALNDTRPLKKFFEESSEDEDEEHAPASIPAAADSPPRTETAPSNASLETAAALRRIEQLEQQSLTLSPDHSPRAN